MSENLGGGGPGPNGTTPLGVAKKANASSPEIFGVDYWGFGRPLREIFLRDQH